VATSDTIEFLGQERQAILAAAGSTLTQAHAQHYDAAGETERQRRLELLFDRVVESLAGRDVTPITTYAEGVADERFAAGYDLAEVQLAVNALEAAIWSRVFAGLEPTRYAETLGLVSTILGAGKDALARRYVSLATDAHAPSLDLRALFTGTG
jgi:hypothetical protein